MFVTRMSFTSNNNINNVDPSSTSTTTTQQRRKSSLKKTSKPNDNSSSLSFSTSSSSSSSSSSMKRLDFGLVEVYEFDVTLGDNPHVSSGCPIATGKMQRKSVVNLESYETYYKSSRKKTRDELRVSVQERAQRLLRAGFAIDEIAEGTLEAERIKHQRSETNRKIKWDGVHGITESFKRTFFLMPTKSTRHLFMMGTPTASGTTTSTDHPADSTTQRVAKSA